MMKTIRIDEDLYRYLKGVADLSGVDVHTFASLCITSFLKVSELVELHDEQLYKEAKVHIAKECQ